MFTLVFPKAYFYDSTIVNIILKKFHDMFDFITELYTIETSFVLEFGLIN